MTGGASAAANTQNTPMYVAYAPEQYQQYKPGQQDAWRTRPNHRR